MYQSIRVYEWLDEQTLQLGRITERIVREKELSVKYKRLSMRGELVEQTIRIWSS